MTFSLVAGDLARTRRTTVVPAKWHPDKFLWDVLAKWCASSTSWTGASVHDIVSVATFCLLEDLEKVSDDDHAEPTFEGPETKTQI